MDGRRRPPHRRYGGPGHQGRPRRYRGRGVNRHHQRDVTRRAANAVAAARLGRNVRHAFAELVEIGPASFGWAVVLLSRYTVEARPRTVAPSAALNPAARSLRDTVVAAAARCDWNAALDATLDADQADLLSVGWALVAECAVLGDIGTDRWAIQPGERN